MSVLRGFGALVDAAVRDIGASIIALVEWAVVWPRWFFVLLFITFMVLMACGVLGELPEDWQGESDLERP